VGASAHQRALQAQSQPVTAPTFPCRLTPQRELSGRNRRCRIAAVQDDLVHRIPIQILAHNEWFNAPIFYDSLAAFVQPNTRAVRKVLDEASDLLQRQMSSASLDAYQQGPERAALIAAAVYEALRTHEIRYISPPASFENTGQKVRTTTQVLDERFGTCIDLAVTYAACIEQTGLHPLIWLVDGHAFAGFMLNEESLKHTSLTETNTMVNLFESHRAIAVEAVYYEQGLEGSFRKAVEAARHHFANPATLRAVIDVSTARRDGVRPLPSAFEDVPEVDEVEPGAVSVAVLDLPPELQKRAPDDAVLDARDESPARVKKWKRSLLDLNMRNRLLNLRPSTQGVDLVIPAQGLAAMDDLMHDGKSKNSRYVFLSIGVPTMICAVTAPPNLTSQRCRLTDVGTTPVARNRMAFRERAATRGGWIRIVLRPARFLVSSASGDGSSSPTVTANGNGARNRRFDFRSSLRVVPAMR
jgi:hypothetical protein